MTWPEQIAAITESVAEQLGAVKPCEHLHCRDCDPTCPCYRLPVVLDWATRTPRNLFDFAKDPDHG